MVKDLDKGLDTFHAGFPTNPVTFNGPSEHILPTDISETNTRTEVETKNEDNDNGQDTNTDERRQSGEEKLTVDREEPKEGNQSPIGKGVFALQVDVFFLVHFLIIIFEPFRIICHSNSPLVRLVEYGLSNAGVSLNSCPFTKSGSGFGPKSHSPVTKSLNISCTEINFPYGENICRK